MRETPLPCMLMCLYGCLIVLTPSADYFKFTDRLHCRRSKESQTYGGSAVHESNVAGESERELQKRGMSFAEAANNLGVQSRTIDSRVKMGLLDDLPVCGPDGTRYVTRVSVQKAIAQPDLMTRRRPKRRGW